MPRKNPVRREKSKAEVRLAIRIKDYEATMATLSRKSKGTKGYRKPGSMQTVR